MANNAETPQHARALLLTRPRGAAEQFVAQLDRSLMADVRTVYSPLLEIEPRSSQVDLSGYVGVILTSANAVDNAPVGEGRMAYCVGARTAKRAVAAGWAVQIVAEDAQDLITKIRNAPVSGPLLHLAGAHRRGQIAERLSDGGIATDIEVLYDQVLAPLNMQAQAVLGGKTPVIVPLFSPRTAVQFAAQAVRLDLVDVVAMSAAVAEPVVNVPPEKVHIAAEPTGAAMVEGVEYLLRNDSLP